MHLYEELCIWFEKYLVKPVGTFDFNMLNVHSDVESSVAPQETIISRS